MERFLGRFTPHLFAVLRFMTGTMFFLHGTQKLFGWPGGPIMPPPLPPMVVAAGWIEAVCGLLIAIGLLGSWAAFIASGQMAYAYFYGHAKADNWFWPTLNQGELAVVYCFLFLYFAAHGSGIWSFDNLLRPRRATMRVP